MSDSEISRKHYRLYITRTYRMDYARIDRIMMYTSADRLAENILDPALIESISSSGNYSSTTLPANVATSAGYWESQNSLADKWVSVKLRTPQPVRAFSIAVGGGWNEFPIDFIFQSSVDGIVWEDLLSSANNPVANLTSFYFETAIYLDLSGISKLENNNPSQAVLVHDWNTGNLIKKVVPDTNGNWKCPLRYSDDVLVTHIGPSGYEPKSDGPITPYSQK